MLYLVTDSVLSLGRPLTEIVQAAAQGGVSIVQLREKDISSREYVELGKALHSILAEYKIPLIINDRADVAMAVGAEGVHVGQSDICYHDLRKMLGKDAIIGLSIENIEQAEECKDWDLDYIAASPVFSTATKTDTAPELGLEGLRELRKIVAKPIVAIGGINDRNIPDVINAGADSIAVVSAICSAADPKKATENLKRIIDECKGHR